MSLGFGDNVGVIAQHYKTITRLFLCKHIEARYTLAQSSSAELSLEGDLHDSPALVRNKSVPTWSVVPCCIDAGGQAVIDY